MHPVQPSPPFLLSRFAVAIVSGESNAAAAILACCVISDLSNHLAGFTGDPGGVPAPPRRRLGAGAPSPSRPGRLRRLRSSAGYLAAAPTSPKPGVSSPASSLSLPPLVGATRPPEPVSANSGRAPTTPPSDRARINLGCPISFLRPGLKPLNYLNFGPPWTHGPANRPWSMGS